MLAIALLIAARAIAATEIAIYTDSLNTGWVDWSWGATSDLSSNSPVHAGAGSAAVTITSAWGALYLHSGTPVATAPADQLQFWVNGGPAGGQALRLVVNHGQSYPFTAAANTWTKISVPMSAVGSPAALTDLFWQDTSGAAQPTFYLDDITLLSSAPPPPAGGPALSIDAGASRHAISDDIYGINFADEAFANELRLPVRRRGGNATSRYNWQNDTYNTGADWYFENIPAFNPDPATLPDGSAADRFVEQDRRTGTRTLLTVPMMGWVAKLRPSGHPYDCGFKVSKYGTQQSTDPWDPDCGNGIAAGGQKITGNDPADTSAAVGPGFVTEWVSHLVGKYGSAAQGGVAYYNLDNEPMLWNSTHRDVHPLPATYDELRDRTFLYGAAVKSADPNAKVLGPVEWGWCGYFYSAADGCAPGADYLAHGSTPLVPWYLRQMRDYETAHGQRILDYLDLHYYPAAAGVSLAPAGSAATQALRLRSTRSLWDASYIDESWISSGGPTAVQMIPRMKNWVAENYPGTRLAITEYNWGAPESINGALAQADVLGIFGREGLDLATFWGDLSATQPGAFAFRMFRNYDGAGRHFGDTSVRAVSANQEALSVYAAERGADKTLTVMVINKSPTALTSSVTLAGIKPKATASVYRYSPANLAAIVQAPDQPVASDGFSATFPANSLTLYVISPQRNRMAAILAAIMLLL